jgi:putative endonuclease
MSSKGRVLYIGFTNVLARRVFEHKSGLMEGFTKKYNVNKLVYYEVLPDLKSAVKRERQLKNWHRKWKIKLIESMNKDWRDLYSEIANPLDKIYL